MYTLMGAAAMQGNAHPIGDNGGLSVLAKDKKKEKRFVTFFRTSAHFSLFILV